MVKCNACGGAYEPIQPDGSQYMHACPPLSAPELAAAVRAGRVELPAGETADQAVERRVYERGNKRDESVVPTGDPAAPRRIRKDGDGVTPIAPAGPPVIIVNRRNAV